jgi:hypothetical protein
MGRHKKQKKITRMAKHNFPTLTEHMKYPLQNSLFLVVSSERGALSICCEEIWEPCHCCVTDHNCFGTEFMGRSSYLQYPVQDTLATVPFPDSQITAPAWDLKFFMFISKPLLCCLRRETNFPLKCFGGYVIH